MKIRKLTPKMKWVVVSVLAVLTIGTSTALAAPDTVHITSSNDNSGPNSLTENTVNASESTDVTMTNDNATTNDFSAELNTGDNTITDNTTGGDLSTGNTNITGHFNNDSSSGLGFWHPGNHSGNLTIRFSNDTIGPSAEAINEVNLDHSMNVEVSNDARISNTFSASLHSGGNTAANNTNTGDVRTGGGAVHFDIANDGGNGTGTLGGMSMGQGGSFSADLENGNTGPNSSATNTVNASSQTNLTATNNSSVSNSVQLTGDSGNNTISGNTDAGDLRTGSYDVDLHFNN